MNKLTGETDNTFEGLFDENRIGNTKTNSKENKKDPFDIEIYELKGKQLEIANILQSKYVIPYNSILVPVPNQTISTFKLSLQQQKDLERERSTQLLTWEFPILCVSPNIEKNSIAPGNFVRFRDGAEFMIFTFMGERFAVIDTSFILLVRLVENDK